jgi:hypothetical protein
VPPRGNRAGSLAGVSLDGPIVPASSVMKKGPRGALDLAHCRFKNRSTPRAVQNGLDSYKDGPARADCSALASPCRSERLLLVWLAFHGCQELTAGIAEDHKADHRLITGNLQVATNLVESRSEQLRAVEEVNNPLSGLNS